MEDKFRVRSQRNDVLPCMPDIFIGSKGYTHILLGHRFQNLTRAVLKNTYKFTHDDVLNE